MVSLNQIPSFSLLQLRKLAIRKGRVGFHLFKFGAKRAAVALNQGRYRYVPGRGNLRSAIRRAWTRRGCKISLCSFSSRFQPSISTTALVLVFKLRHKLG